MIKILKNNWPLVILSLIAVIVCFQNYTPGTILSGWDTLHPEFNFGLNLKREIFGVFRTYQGLGAMAAHSDMADLPRIVILAIFGLVLPQDFLRYSYIFLALILGHIGVYLFLYKHVLKDKSSSFLGGLFYLLNLGTLQLFAVPFEMFVTQYAALPWLFLFATDYLFQNTQKTQKSGNSDTPSFPGFLKRRTLLLFAITTILAAPQAYAATLWYIYFIAFSMYVSLLSLPSVVRHSGLSRISQNRWRFRMRSAYQNDGVQKENLVKKALVLILLTLLLNSFWILPNIYYVINHGPEVPQANINKLFSEQAFLYNKEFGNIKDIALLKSFLFDWNVYAGNNHFVQLLTPWIQHLKYPFVQLLGYLFALLAFAGIIYSLFKRNKILIALLPLLFLCLFFLFNDNPPTSPLYSMLRDHLGFFKEAYRFPQDKVRGVFVFLFAIYFAAGQLLIFRLITLIKIQRGLAQASQIIIFSILLFFFMFPAFKGELISPYMRTKIPDFYFEMFEWFDKQPEDGRVANLPIHSLWGWDYYKWTATETQTKREPQKLSPSADGSDKFSDSVFAGFQGAGFIWFGIKQPILARDFDRWSPYNEQYYREMSYAIYSQNPQALRSTIEKYNIKYILLDKNIIAPPNPAKSLLYEETEALLENQDYIQKPKVFGNSLLVYKVDLKTPDNYFVLQNPFIIKEKSKVFYEDFIYKEYGDYIVQPDEAYYPYRNLTDNQNRVLPNILKLTQEGIIINLPKNVKLDLPSYLDAQDSLPSDLLVEREYQTVPPKDQLIIKFYPRLPSVGGAAWYPPITLKSPLPESENLILSINKKNNFILDASLSDTPLSLGLIFLDAKKDNTISIYPSVPNQELIPDLSTTNYYLEPCEKIFGGYQTAFAFGTELLDNNSFYIFGNDVALCMTIPLSEVLPKDLKDKVTLLTANFNYSSNLPLKFCITKIDNGACQNHGAPRVNLLFQRNVPLGPHPSEAPSADGAKEDRNNSASYYFGLENKNIENLGLQFQLDTSRSEKIEKALYDNLSLSLTYPSFSTTFLTPSTLSTIPTSSASSTLTIPFSGDQQLSANITEFAKTTGRCPGQSSSSLPVTKKEILKDSTSENDSFIRYSSQVGTACDHFSYQNLSQNEAFLIAITSRNIKGLPLTICIANQVTKHCDIYASLSSSSSFTTDIFLLPPGVKNQSGYDVNIRNLGIKKTPAVNDLKSIQIIPFPYMWFSQIKSGAMKQWNNETMNVLVLPQSFEKGWKAYRVQNYESGIMNWVNNTFPFLFGEKLKEHVLVNGWSNGWILNNEAMKQLNNSSNATIVFLFLPQYLEFAGFLLLAGTIIYLVKRQKNDNT